MKDQKKTRKVEVKPMTHEEHDEYIAALDGQRELEEQFRELEDELRHLDRRGLIWLIMQERESTTNFSSGTMLKHLNNDEVKKIILNTSEGQANRIRGRSKQASQKKSNQLGVSDFYELMKEVVERMDDSENLEYEKIRVETDKAIAIAADLLSKSGRSTLNKTVFEWRRFLKKKIESNDIKTARLKLKNTY